MAIMKWFGIQSDTIAVPEVERALLRPSVFDDDEQFIEEMVSLLEARTLMAGKPFVEPES